ncbi:MAG: antitoxin family protein [Candidatus Hydrothermarchaeales archaeon]
MTKAIEAIYEKGVFIPTEKPEIPERSKVIIRIEKLETTDEMKILSYARLMTEGEDAEELFEF